jgi:hypothetical protein
MIKDLEAKDKADHAKALVTKTACLKALTDLNCKESDSWVDDINT